MEFHTIQMEIPSGTNIIIGQTHFIKSAEDLYEAIISSVPGGKFGLAFCEASGPCLIRAEGNDESLRETAVKNAQQLGAGHSFVILLRDVFPINVLNAIKSCPEYTGPYTIDSEHSTIEYSIECNTWCNQSYVVPVKSDCSRNIEPVDTYVFVITLNIDNSTAICTYGINGRL